LSVSEGARKQNRLRRIAEWCLWVGANVPDNLIRPSFVSLLSAQSPETSEQNVLAAYSLLRKCNFAGIHNIQIEWSKNGFKNTLFCKNALIINLFS